MKLNQQPGYKLGLVTAVQIMEKTGDLSALDTVEALFGRTAFVIPTMKSTDPVPVMAKAGKLSKEFSDVIEETSLAMADGHLDGDEIEKLTKEVEDLLLVCIRFKALLQQIRPAATTG
jgi:regulatory protein CII